MKLSTGLPEEKLLPVDDATMEFANETLMSSSSRTKNWTSEKFGRILKIVLYLELIIFIACLGFYFYPFGNSHSAGTTISANEIRPNKFTSVGVDDRTADETIRSMNRYRRSTNDDKIAECQKNMNVTAARMSELINSLAVGDDSDPNVVGLRELCRQRMVDLTMRVMIMKLTGPTDSMVPSDQQWHEIAVDVKERITSQPGDEVREQITSEPITPEITNEVREIVESMIRNYRNCERVISFGPPKTEPTIAEVLNAREQCGQLLITLKKRIQPMVNKIIPGDSGDPIVVGLREDVERVAVVLASAAMAKEGSGLNATEIMVKLGNLTSDDWNGYLVKLREDLLSKTDSEHRRGLEQTGTSTVEIAGEIRDFTEEFLDVVKECKNIEVFIGEVRKELENSEVRTKRAGPGPLAPLFRVSSSIFGSGQILVSTLFDKARV